MSLNRSPKQYTGVRPINPPNIIYADREPLTTDTSYVKGDIWLNQTGSTAHIYNGGGVWIQLGGGGGAGSFTTLTSSGATTLATTGASVNTFGNSTGATSIAITSGTGGISLTSTGSGDIALDSDDTLLVDADGVLELNSSAGIISIGNDADNQNINIGTAGTRTLAIGSATATETILGTVNMNASGSAVTTIGTGGTGAVNIGNTTGNTAVTGSLTASTSLTASAGDITATAGHVIINGAAKQLRVHGGAETDFIGTLTLTNGQSAAIANSNIAATDRIFIIRTAINASTALGTYDYAIVAASAFSVTAKKSDTTTETGDQSTLAYLIVRQV